MQRILTWVKPTGNGMHIWNYLGMFKPFIENVKWKEAFLFIPDLHSLTSVHDAETLQRNKKRLAAEIFALIPENSKVIVFEQSEVTHLNSIVWALSSVTPYALMLRAHSFKDSQNKNTSINMATFNYPILMAADIIAYDVDIVPVGKDQKQHIEFARDIAQNFNNTYNVEFFKLPEGHIDQQLQTIPGTDGRKMSKSYDNFIWVFDDKKTLKKKIMSIETGSETLEESKNPETCNVFALIKFFASQEKQDQIAHKYREWNYGYGHAKLELLDIILDYFKEARERYSNYMNDYSLIDLRLEAGNKRANELVSAKYVELKKIVGLS